MLGLVVLIIFFQTEKKTRWSKHLQSKIIHTFHATHINNRYLSLTQDIKDTKGLDEC